MAQSEILKNIQTYFHLLEERGIPVSFGVLYGSQATGNAHKWSDINLVVVSPLFDKKDLIWEDTVPLYRAAGELNCMLHPVPSGEKEWFGTHSREVLEVANLEGIRIDPIKGGSLHASANQEKSPKSKGSEFAKPTGGALVGSVS